MFLQPRNTTLAQGPPDDMRERLLARLSRANALASWIDQVTNVVELDRADQGRAFGESLPAGLRLVPESREDTAPNRRQHRSHDTASSASSKSR